MTDEEFYKLTKLCQIACTEEEKQAFKEQIAGVLSYIKLLDEVQTEGVATCYQVLDTLGNVMREDVVRDTLPRDEFLANAPAHIGGMIRVPPVIKPSNS